MRSGQGIAPGAVLLQGRVLHINPEPRDIQQLQFLLVRKVILIHGAWNPGWPVNNAY